MIDAQFSVATVLKPYVGFEADYQGESCRRPIMFPGGLSPNAGKPGYASNLIAGVPVPYGSKVSLWVPTIYRNGATEPEQPPDLQVIPYRFQFIWRLKNLQDYRMGIGDSAYHFPKQSPGATGQVVVPAGQKVIIYEGSPQTFSQSLTAPNSQFSGEYFATQQAVLERIEFESTTPLPPFIPGGADGAYQQGVAALSGVDVNETVSFNCIQMDAEGDELLIAMDRLGGEGEVSGETTWNFTDNSSVDFAVSVFFGAGSGTTIRDLGIYLLTGANP